MLRKGHKFKAPDGKSGGYKLTSDLYHGDTLKAELFSPYGGQPNPDVGMPMPEWLALELRRLADGKPNA